MVPNDLAPRRLELTGLSVGSPIGFMAALGLLRVLGQDLGLPVRLSWQGGHACLHGADRAAVVEALRGHMAGRSRAPEFNFEVDAGQGLRAPVQHLRNLTPDDYARAVEALAGDARALSFLAGFATDAVVNDKGFIARTRFDFSSGQQKLVEEFRNLAELLDPGARRPRRSFDERAACALFCGAYETQHTLGWDPATLMAHVHQRAAPSDSATPGQPMTVWMAVESLPLHPVVPISPRRAQTVGFVGGSAYVWPQWDEPLTLAEVALLRQRPVETLFRLPGVTAVWKSEVTSVGKYGFLRPAARTSSVDSPSGRFAQRESADL